MYIGIALYYIYVYVDLSANFRIQKMLAEFSLVSVGLAGGTGRLAGCIILPGRPTRQPQTSKQLAQTFVL